MESLFLAPFAWVDTYWINLCDLSSYTVHASEHLSTMITVFVTVFVSLLIAYIYKWAVTPINRVRDLSQIGFWHLTETDRRRHTLRELANEAIKQRKVGEVPPVYPNGWFVVKETNDLKVGAVAPLYVLGLNLVVFRGEDKISHILDAYCPHLGAHLGVGSKVSGNCIVCPFHGWRFNGDSGKCTAIPYADEVPDFAKIKTWHSREMNGYIYLWFHAEKEDPYWEPVEVEEITQGKYVYRGRSEHYVKAHIQEIPENGADVAHLAQVHGGNLLYGNDLRKGPNRFLDLASHLWNASWKVGEEPNKHTANLVVSHSLRLMGKYNLITIQAHVTQFGPATVHLNFETPFGKAVLFHNVTPVEPVKQQLTHALYCEKSMPHLYSKLIMLGEAIMVERDIVIWNSKTFMHKPLLVKEDKFIPRMRRWYAQFYSENSPRLQFQKETMEW